MSDTTYRRDDDLVQALEHEGDLLTGRGQTVQAAAAQHAASTLRQSVKDHQVAVDDFTRLGERAKSPTASPADTAGLALAQTALRGRWTELTGSRDRAIRLLSTHR